MRQSFFISRSRTETCLGIDEQVIGCQPAAVDKDPHIYSQTDQMFRLDSFEQGDERYDENKVIGEEAEELPKGVVPAWTEKRMQEVKGIAEEDTAKDDG
jgi:hypothetical protein